MADTAKLEAAYQRLVRETADTAKLAAKERAELVKAKTPAEKKLDQLKAEKLAAFKAWQAALAAGDTAATQVEPAPPAKLAKGK